MPPGTRTRSTDPGSATGAPPRTEGLFDRLLGSSPGALRQVASPVTFEPHETLYREGERATGIYVLRGGRVKLLSHLESGRARILRLHARGAVLGLAGLTGRNCAHTAQAIDDVAAWRVPLTELRATLEREPRLYAALLADCLRELAAADTWIRAFATGPIRSRVARFIRYLVSLEDPASPAELTLLTAEEMADVLGVTPESVSRVIAEFRRDGILAPGEGSDPLHHVSIARPERLAEAAEY